MTQPTTTTKEAPLALEPSDGLNMHSLTGDIVVFATRELPDDQREAIRWLHAFSRENGWTLHRLSDEIKLSNTVLYRVFTGKYPAKLDNVVEKIRSYRTALGLKRADDVQFVETSISKRIFKAAEWALSSSSIVFVFGNRGLGKTFSFEEFRRTHNHGTTKLVRMPASAGVQLMMQEFARACYISPKTCFDNLRESVLRSLDKTNLLIVDELHQVFLSYQKGSAIKCLEVIREIHDRTGCGMVLSGTNQLKENILLGQHRELLEQFTDRGVLQVQLPTTVPRGDVLAIASAYGIKGEPSGTAGEIVDEILKARSLRKFGKLLDAAKRYATKRNEAPAWTHFVSAHDILSKVGTPL